MGYRQRIKRCAKQLTPSSPIGSTPAWNSVFLKPQFIPRRSVSLMTNTDQLRASEQINLLAIRNSWPLICDPHLDFATPELKSALAIWQAKRGSRTMPTRDDMNFRDLKTFLPHLAFLTIVRDGARVRFKVRLAGSALDTFLGGSTTGRFVDEAVPQRFAEKWAAMWISTIDSRTPTRTVGRAEMPGRGYYISE